VGLAISAKMEKVWLAGNNMYLKLMQTSRELCESGAKVKTKPREVMGEESSSLRCYSSGMGEGAVGPTNTPLTERLQMEQVKPFHLAAADLVFLLPAGMMPVFLLVVASWLLTWYLRISARCSSMDQAYRISQ